MSVNIEKYESSTEAVDKAATKLLDTLSHPVKTLLLLSGGSSLAVAKEVFSKLSKEQKKFITIAQIDERYGKPGHENSNWNGIEELAQDFNDYAGVANILQDNGGIEEDCAMYNARLRQLLVDNVLKVGLFGVGANGHIAGMLPGEPADFMKYTDGRLVVNFEGSDFPRITTTSALMKVLDEAIVYACGPNKKKAIQKLEKKLPANEHPAQLLNEANEAWLYYAEKE